MDIKTKYKILCVSSVLCSFIGAGIFLYRLACGIFEISWIFVFMAWFCLTQAMMLNEEIVSMKRND